eukprot:521418-Karenia_brevis.AAC.1
MDNDLRHFLLKSKIAVLWDEAKVARRPDGRPLLAGLFCVPHKETTDRMIFDRRPQNHAERRLGWCRLPLGSQLVRIKLRPDQDIRACGDDLKSYFNQLRDIHPDSLARNCFGRVFDGFPFQQYGG